MRFFFCNPKLKIARLTSISYSYINRATITNIKLFFKYFKASELANIFLEQFFNTNKISIS